jgi:hypothetical protein
VRDVFHVSGLLRFDAFGSVVEVVLNQEACLARSSGLCRPCWHSYTSSLFGRNFGSLNII